MALSKIFSSSHPKTEQAVSLEREVLEEYPVVEDVAEEVEVIEEVVEPTPEEIRTQVFQEARAEVEAKVEEAYKEGFARGEEAGRAAFDASIAECSGALTQAAEAMQQARENYLNSATPQVIDLVKLVTRRVLDREILMEEGALLRMVERAMVQLLGQESMTIRVHPDDLVAMKEHKLTLLSELDGLEELNVTCDDTIAPGGCVVETAEMIVDAQLETLLTDTLESMMG